MKYYCNPINVPYRYQFNAGPAEHWHTGRQRSGRPVNDLL